MLASIFVIGGVGTLRDPGPPAKRAAPLVDSLAPRLPNGLPKDPVTLVRLDAGVKIIGGLGLALGKAPRLCALALAGSQVPTTVARYPFWKESDPAVRAQQRIHFLENVGLLGGLLLAAVDTEGRPSIGWRAKRQARTFAKASREATKHSTRAVHRATERLTPGG